MKPIPLTTDKDRRRDSFDRAVGKYRRSPITDYSYQSAAFGESSGVLCIILRDRFGTSPAII